VNPDILAAASLRLNAWLVEQALPFWGVAGFDREQRRFEERLDLAGRPIRDVPIRLMVQARQIYVYSLATRRGWYSGARTLVQQAFESMVRDYHRPDGRAGWVFSVRRDGTVAEPRRDLYSHAFVLLAVASFVLATGDRGALSLADETLAFLDAEMRAPQAGGYIEGLPPVGVVRCQNPHMHLFEGLLALWSASADRRYLARAKTMFELFRTRFFQPGPGVLCEYFDETLAPAAGELGRVVEPGHHCEWVWLLRWFERESGEPTGSYVDALYGHVLRHGYDQAGLIVDEVLIDGSHRTPSHRIWPVTEAIKANVAEALQGRGGTDGRTLALVTQLFDRYLTSRPVGGWIDRLDAHGAHATDFMPASSLYHLASAIDELDRHVRKVQVKPLMNA
jgi:mannose-6-phosphate isomerase